ncbi:hypothetical protein KUTeg_013725 [Tegillarca granosa]|uniref:Rhodanese domain-containing protein n=1 Tax=Tegillarca granosa TaxID=220873 RepID=A0ABQ9EX00_TEGGR|nr:hypothetical protein KUTeg_013725 [Tegillarca granosa]
MIGFALYGHKKISILDGGFMKWVEDGFQTSVEEIDIEKAGDFVAKIDQDLLFDFEMMKKNLEKKSHQMVDARGAKSFIGEEDIEGDIKHGHIPGARNIPFSDLFNEDGTFKSDHALKQLFDAANIDLGRPVVASCLTGMTACGLAAAMHVLGKEKVPVYYVWFLDGVASTCR